MLNDWIAIRRRFFLNLACGCQPPTKDFEFFDVGSPKTHHDNISSVYLLLDNLLDNLSLSLCAFSAIFCFVASSLSRRTFPWASLPRLPRWKNVSLFSSCRLSPKVLKVQYLPSLVPRSSPRSHASGAIPCARQIVRSFVSGRRG